MMVMMMMMMTMIMMMVTMNKKKKKKKVSYFTSPIALYVESKCTINRQFHNGNYANMRITAHKLVKIAHY